MLIHPYQYNIGQALTYQDIDFFYHQIPSYMDIFVGYLQADVQQLIMSNLSIQSNCLLQLCQIITSYLFPQHQVQSFEIVNTDSVYDIKNGFVLLTNNARQMNINENKDISLPSFSIVQFQSSTTFSLSNLSNAPGTAAILIHFN